MAKKRTRMIAVLSLAAVILMSILTGCSSRESIPIPNVEEDIYVYDEDNVIDDKEEKKLNTMLGELENRTEVEFAVLSIESLQGYSIEEYANEVFNTLGIGKKGEDNGVLLIFSRSDEKVRLEIGRGIEGFLNDSKCGRILDEYFVPYREKDQYTKATSQTVQAVSSVIAEEYGIDIEGIDIEQVEQEEDIMEALFFGIQILCLLVLVFWVLFGDSDGSYGGGSYGGFFGGGGSSGGFGGGFSGGGGASR